MVKLIDSDIISNIMFYNINSSARGTASSCIYTYSDWNRVYNLIERSLSRDIKAGNRLVYRRVKEMYKCKKVDNFTEIEPIGGLV